MHELNQYAISKILGSTMKSVKPPQFGGFGLLGTTAEAVLAAANLRDERNAAHPEVSYDLDKIIVRAFEDVRDGVAPDAILWDKALAEKFQQRCRELELNVSQAVLNRRLLNIRKNSKRYAKHGITISPTTKSSPHASIVSQYAYVIEFALVRLRYSHGASIDDILLDPVLGTEFERVALKSAPQLSVQNLRLGALYIRKTRYLNKREVQTITSLNVGVLAPLWKRSGSSLATLSTENLPASPGLIELKERNRYLYIGRNDNIRTVASQFQGGDAFGSVADGFWKPDPEEITLEYISGVSIKQVNAGRWERRLIHDREPVLNWPVVRKGDD